MNEETHYLQKELYQKIQKDPSIFDFMQEGFLDGLWYWDLENPENEWMSSRFWETMGYDPSKKQHLASEWQDLIHPDDLKIALDNFNKHCADPNHPYDQVVRYRHKDGSTIWIRCRGIAVRDENGKPIRMLGAHTDITPLKKAEEALQASERELKRTLDATTDGIWTWNFKTNQLFFSPRYYKMLGYVPGEFSASYDIWRDLLHPDDREKALAVAREYLQAKADSYVNEFRLRTKNGEYRWIHARGRVVERDENGDAVYMIGNHEDITDRKIAEEALRENEQHFRSLYEQAPLGYQSLNKQGSIIEVNQAWLNLTGYKHNQVIGRSFADFLAPHEVDAFKQRFPRFIEMGETHVDIEIRRKDGFPLLVHIDGKIGYDDRGQFRQTHCLLHDITKAREAERAIQESEERYRSLVENTSDGYFMSEASSGKFLYLNQKICDLFGYTMQEAMVLSIWDVIDIPEHEQIRERIQSKIENNKPTPDTNIYTAIRKDGIRFRVEVTYSMVKYQNNLAIQGVLRDVTEREQLQLQLQQSQKMDSVGRLAGGVAHDFNNMLGVILGQTEMILMGMKPGDRHYERLEEIQKVAKRSADLTRQLLAFARKQTIAPKLLDLNETIEGLLKMLRRLIGENIHLLWKPGAYLWYVKMDPAQIDQILANLCVNARDAISDVGKVTIETTNTVLDTDYCADHEECVPGEYVMLAVSDDGCGMDKVTQAQIFEPFFTTRGIGEGTGLGLSTVYGIVNQNDGFINVYSEVGKGTTFKIYLPRYEGALSSETKSNSKTAPKGHGETVLLVEDDPSILNMGKAILEHLGYKVLAINEPTKALDICKAQEGKIHLLITDVVMPHMSGKTLADKIHNIKPEISVLYMSGYTANAIAHQGVLEADVNFIQKPFSLEELAKKVQQALNLEKGQRNE